MDTFIKNTIMSWMIAFSWLVKCQDIATTRELPPEETKWKIAVVIKMMWNRVESICNYWRMLIQDKPMTVIAKHCVIPMTTQNADTELDYLVTPNITALFQKRWLDIKFLAPYEAPIRHRSDETEKSIIWKQVIINSCIPWSWFAMQCWEIKWNAHASPFVYGQNSIKISNSDYKKILVSGDRTSWAVTWMSWNVVLDSEWKVFWVLSMASDFDKRKPYQIISFESLRQTGFWWKTVIIPE